MLTTDPTPSFTRHCKRCTKKHRDVPPLDAALAAGAARHETPISADHNDHALTDDRGCSTAGRWAGQ